MTARDCSHRQDLEAIQALLDFHRIARGEVLRDATHHYHDQQWQFANSMFHVALRQLDWYRVNRWPIPRVLTAAVNWCHYTHFSQGAHMHFLLSDTATVRWQRVLLHAQGEIPRHMHLREVRDNQVALSRWFTRHTEGLVAISMADLVLLRMSLQG